MAEEAAQEARWASGLFFGAAWAEEEEAAEEPLGVKKSERVWAEVAGYARLAAEGEAASASGREGLRRRRRMMDDLLRVMDDLLRVMDDLLRCHRRGSSSPTLL